MKFLRFTLLSDGSSDRALIPYLIWLLKENGVSIPIYEKWADLSHLRQRPQNLTEKIEKGVEFYPCDLLFIHRDAERENPDGRRKEITEALAKSNESFEELISICVIPVRMMEAWLLFDEAAIRRASGNPNGSLEIDLPGLKTVEGLPNPKETLDGLLRAASERTGRRLKQFNVRHSAGQVSQFIEDFTPLRSLSAFQALENDIKEIIEKHDWK